MRELRVIVRTLSGKNFIYMTMRSVTQVTDQVLDLFIKIISLSFTNLKNTRDSHGR